LIRLLGYQKGSRIGRQIMLKTVQRYGILVLAIFAISALSACSPEVGSKEWCEDLKAKPKGDWSANEAADFAKHCVL
jgi:hypothetical protein